MKKLFKHYDYSLVVTVLLLTGFGVIMVYSSSTIFAVMHSHPSNYYFTAQIKWAAVAIIAGFLGLTLPYKMYKSLVKPITFGTLLLLVVVLIAGHVGGNAQSWLYVAGLSIQPAEIAKLAVIIYLAAVFSNKQAFISDFKTSVLPPLVMISLFFLLITVQPDLGSAMIVAGIAGTVVLCSGIRVKHILMLLALATVAIGIIFAFSLSNEQSGRFAAAYEPFSPQLAKGDGLQVINSYIAIASGGLTGKGLGNSIEKAGFLPAPYTDFIIAIIAEELGVLAVLFVLLCILYIVIKGIYIGIRCQDVFGSLLAIGIASFIGIQALINLGAVTGLLPVTGVTLPFISYGGSSLVMSMFSVGVLVNVSGFVRLKQKVRQEEAA